MISSLLKYISLMSATYSTAQNVKPSRLYKSMNIIADYNGPLPYNKLQQVDYVFVDNSNITFADEENVSFPQLARLSVRETIQGKVPDSLMNAFPNLQELNIIGGEIEDFQLDHFNTFETLQIFTIDNVQIERVKENCLHKLKQLKYLSINSAQMKHIEVNAFNGLESLEILNLSGNKLGNTLNQKMLSTNKFILGCFLLAWSIFMVASQSKDDEAISTDEFAPVIIENANFIEQDDFSHIDSRLYQDVMRVSIESSNLTQIPRKFLGELPGLIELTLKNNIIKSFGIKSLDYYFATKLQRLTIRNQNVGPLLNDSFIGMRNLTYLALICTFPSRIETSSFNGLAKLDELDLSGNNLTAIDKQLLQPLKKLRILVLNNNNFEKFTYIPVLSNLERIYLENNPIRRSASVDRDGLRQKAPKLRSIKFCTRLSISCQNFENICRI